MKKTIIAISAALLLTTSFLVYAAPAETKVQANNQECCEPNPNCVCVPTPDGGYVCVPVSQANQGMSSAVEQSCSGESDCVCD